MSLMIFGPLCNLFSSHNNLTSDGNIQLSSEPQAWQMTCIKAVQGLAIGHHYVVGDVHDVVDGAQTYDAQAVLQPFGALLHLASGQCQGAIAGACLGSLHSDGNLQVGVVHLECVARGTVQGGPP